VSPPRLLLCRPLGGLNDMLCQIERAAAYADQFDRTLVVDTSEQSKRYFRDRLSRYFISLQPNLKLDLAAAGADLDALEPAPAFLKGRVSRYRMRFDPARQSFVETESGLPVTFDFSKDHAQPLLVHHMSGGGVHAVNALGRLRLEKDLLATLKARLRQIGAGYVGVHIRNTDYRARYAGLLGRIRVEPSDRIFVATDNAASLRDCQIAFGADRVFSFAALPADGRPAHHIEDPATAYQRNRDSILDLVMLALARDLSVFELEPNAFGARFSGYSVLAANLRSNRPLLASLITGDEAGLDALLAG
jgi:hypothetical protein